MKNLRQIDVHRKEEDQAADLERYAQRALELGADRARVVEAAAVPVDERVALKCRIPLCFGYGVCANCPPHAPKPAEMRDQMGRYQKGVFFTHDVAPEVVARNKATIKERIDAYKQLFETVNALESEAFYDGHYLAFGLAGGSCRHSLCADAADCRALTGGRCRHSLRARPSLEAVGIDAFRMIAESGWDVYPIGSDAQPEDIPGGSLAGLVMIY